MTTITIEISTDLEKRLRPYQHDLPHILELGLRSLALQSKPLSETQPEQIIATLHQAGAVGPELSTTTDYLVQADNQTWQPVQAAGKPASDIIIEQRHGLNGE